MRSLTIRLPDDTAARLKGLARSRGQSMNKLIEELSAQALAAWDTENHFLAQLDLVAVAQIAMEFGSWHPGLREAFLQELLQDLLDAAVQSVPLVERVGQEFQPIAG